MGNSKIDTIIQHKLSGHKTAINAQALWAAIEGDVVTNDKIVFLPPTSDTPDKTGNTILRILPLLLLAAAVGVTGMYLFTSGSTVDSYDKQSIRTEIASSNITLQENPQPTDNNALVAPMTLEDNESANTTTKSSEQDSQLKKTHTKAQPANATTIINETQQVITKQVIATQITQRSTPPPTINETVFTASNSDLTSRAQFPSVSSDKSTVLTTKTINSARTATLAQLGRNTLNPLNYNKTAVAISDDYMAPVKDKISCYSYGPSKLQISGLLYYGPGASLRSLKANGTEMNTLVEERENSEVVLENHRAGLQLKATTNSGIYFKAGLERSIINEKFQQFSMDTTMEIRQVVVEIIEYPDGSTDEILGDQLVTIISRKEWKKYNQFKTFDLTAIVGYEGTVRNWRYAIEGGVIYNFNTQFNGTILDDVSLLPTDDTGKLFKSETGVDLHLAAGLGFDLSPSMTLWAMPSIRFDLKDINQASYNVDQSYQMANLLLGLEYRF